MSCQRSEDPGPELDPGFEPERIEVPGNFRVQPGTPRRSCALSWTPPPGSIDAYEVVASESEWTFRDGTNDRGLLPATATQAELIFRVPEFTRIEIKIRARRGNHASEFSPVGDCALPLLDPLRPFTMLENDGIHIHWLNDSPATTAIEIAKAELDASGAPGAWSVLTTVPGELGHSSHVDSAVSIGTAYGYRITGIAGDHRSRILEMRSLQLGPPMTTTTIQLPLAPIVATDGQGNYAFASHGFSTPSMLHVAWGSGPTWNTVMLDNVTRYDSVIKLDAAGLPHAVYGKQPASGSGVVITHGWSNGTEWLEESIAQRTLEHLSNLPALQFDVDPVGNAVTVWHLGDQRFEAALKVGGAWTVTPLDSLLPVDPYTAVGTYHVFTDQTGIPHVLAATTSVLSHLEARNGVWTQEVVPPPSELFGYFGAFVGAGRDPDHLAICIDTLWFGIPTRQAACVRKSLAGWGSFERLGNLKHTSTALKTSLALSRDGTRLAALCSNGPGRVYRSALGGPWSEAIVSPLHDPFFGLESPVIGFDAAGKFFVLSGGAPFDGTIVIGDYQLEREP